MSRSPERLSRHSVTSSFLDPLEPRQLLTTYTATPIADLYAMPDDELFVLAAPSGVDIAGFGDAAAVIGDVDGDGGHDFAVAAPGRAATGGSPAINGYVFLYSGKTHALLATINGAAPGFGAVVAAAGDVNADGKPDLFIGSPASALAAIHSGADGSSLHALTGDPGSEFGFSFARLDDVNADDVADFVIGAPSQDGHGAAFIVNGADFTILREISGTQAGSRFGHAVASWGDLTDQVTPADGIRELFVGAPDWDTDRDGLQVDAGAFFVYEPVTGAALQQHESSYAGGHSGYSIIGIEEYLWVGAPAGADGPAGKQGGWVYRSQASEAPGQWVTVPSFQHASAQAGDRIGEWLDVGTALNGEGEAALVIGTAFRTSYVVTQGDDWTIAAERAMLGDLNGDSIPDVLGLHWTNPSDVAVRAVSATFYEELRVPTGFSRNGTFIYSQFASGSGYRGTYIASADSFLAVDAIPALADEPDVLVITAISDDGVIAAYTYRQVGGGTFFDPFGYERVALFLVDLASPTVRRSIEDLAVNIVGPTPDFTEMTVTFFGPDGDVFMTEESSDGSRRAWVLSGDTLSFMWNGFATDQAADGTVLGIDTSAWETTRGVTWTQEDGAVAIPSLADVWQFAPDGAILGRSFEGDLVIIRNGTATRVRDFYKGTTYNLFGGWTPIGIDSAGRILYQSLVGRTVVVPPSRGDPNGSTFDSWAVTTQLIDVSSAPYLLQERVEGGGADDRFGLPGNGSAYPFGARRSFAFTNDGRIITATHVLTPVPGDTIGAGDLSAAPSPSAPGVLGVTSGGMPYSLRLNDRGEWVTTLLPQIDQVWSAGLYHDPKDGQTYVVAFGRQTLDGRSVIGAIYRQLSDGSLVDGFEITLTEADAIRGDIVVFTAPDGRVHIAGISEAGGLMMFYQTGARFPDGRWDWGADNISANHFFANGITAPRWNAFTQLTAYVTSWGGLNVAGVESGAIKVAWWAPGMSFWALDNLSQNADLEPVTGPITSYVTAWDGLNIAAFDASGDIQVAWWVPGFGTQWRKGNLTEETAGLKLTSLSAFVTPWGALNIAGIDAATGRPAVYWWTPATNQWISEIIPFEGESAWPGTRTPLRPVLMGPQQNLLGLTDDSGDVTRLYWNPGDAAWTLENLTALAM